jgi:7,8-dihydroneopterin aldolase/epimerase/oxygenase
MDQLIINSLTVSTRIGIYAWEERMDQKLCITVVIPYDFSLCDETLQNTIDYDVLCQRITNFVESRPFKLIETVANEVARLIKQEFKVDSVTVRVSKPHAIKNAGPIEVVVVR